MNILNCELGGIYIVNTLPRFVSMTLDPIPGLGD